MAVYLGILIFSFIISAIALVPFIDFLYSLHFTYRHPLTSSSPLETREFSLLNRLQSWKIGTPIGGGILILFLVTLLFAILFPLLSRFGIQLNSSFNLKEEINVLFFTFMSFGLLGLYDDIRKIFQLPSPNPVYRLISQKDIISICLSIIIAFLLYLNLGINIINIPFLGPIKLSYFYIPLASGVIFVFAKAYDITDGLDGLANGILLICLVAFWGISVTAFDSVLSTFIALWIGSLLAFMYFNVFPARIWLGNSGSMAFGSTLAVIGLLLGKTVALFIIGGFFIVEFSMKLIQKIGQVVFKRKVFFVTPFHYYLRERGWPEPKIVMRAWLATCILSFFGLWLATA